MAWSDALILGILQGITEFLPISSSGHLVLGEHFLGLNVASLKSFDVAVHVGTLLAILVYFWRDIWGMLRAVGRLFVGRLKLSDAYGKLILWIVIGTVPAALLGFFGEEWIDGLFRNPTAVGGMFLVVALVYLLGEFVYKRRGSGKMTVWKAIVIGCAQALALIPGVSRSGSTIVAGLFQGVKREAAARFSFLLGVPAIAGAGFLTYINRGPACLAQCDPLLMGIGFVSAFIFGLLSVSWLMRFLKGNRLVIFSIYLIAVGFGVFV